MLNPAPSSYKETSAEGLRGTLPGFSLLAFEGPEAAAFLQAQLMNDVRALAPGQWQWNGWLSAGGRVICLFALWRRDEQHYLALLPDFPAAELQPRLQRYVFRSKLRIAVEAGFVVCGSFSAGHEGGARDVAARDGEAWRFDFGGDELQRQLLLLPRDEAPPWAREGSVDAPWREADLAHGLARLDEAQREAWTPQMLSLQRLNAFSLSKGCYPGQEIVARTHYLGQAKRELVRLRGTGLAAGAGVSGGDGRKLGTVVCASADGASGLAVLASERGAVFNVEGLEAGEVPLLAGMQRPP